MKELPWKARVLVIAVLLAGGAALVYSARAVWRGDPYVALVFVILVGGSTLFTVRPPKPGAGAKDGPRGSGPHSVVFGMEDYFVFIAALAASPETAALTAAFGSTLISLGTLSKARFYRGFYNGASHTLTALACASLFYWLLGHPAPFRFDTATDLVGALLLLNLSALVYEWLSLLLTTLAVSLSSNEPLLPHIRNEVWTFIGAFTCATAAGANHFAFPDSPLAAGLAGFPVLWLVQSFRRFEQRRISSLSESRELLQSSLDALSAAIAVLDSSGRIVAVNEAWRANIDRRRPFGGWLRVGDNYLQACRADLTRRVDASRAIADGIGEALAGDRRALSLEYGSPPGEVWHELRVSVFDSPRWDRVVIAHRDISERVRSAARLRESEAKYRRFFENDLTGDFVANGLGRVTDCNPAFARMIGYAAPEQALRSGLSALFPDPPLLDELRESLSRLGKVEYLQAEIRRLDGGTLNAVCNFTAELDESGDLVGIRGYLFDDTERRKLEEALIQAQKMEAVGRLAGGLAHEVNNILTVVAGYAEFLGNALSCHRVLRREASRVLRAARKGGGLTEQLLVFSRGGPITSQARPLDPLVEECAGMLRRLLSDRIRLVLRLGAPNAAVGIDRERMERVLLNLALNARDAMPEGGRLRLETRMASPDTAVLSVSDTGAGIPEDARELVFEPFFTTKAEGKGTGLGLAAVRRVVRESGGEIEVFSRPGRGTRFEIQLPATAPRQPRTASPKRRAALAKGSETVLVVEDQSAIRELVSETLRRLGYRVLEASNGAEAVGFLESSDIAVDLLLTDIVMPRMGGSELAERVRGSGDSDLKVLYISGHPNPLGAGDGIQRLSKPFTPRQLAATVRRLLDS